MQNSVILQVLVVHQLLYLKRTVIVIIGWERMDMPIRTNFKDGFNVKTARDGNACERAERALRSSWLFVCIFPQFSALGRFGFALLSGPFQILF